MFDQRTPHDFKPNNIGFRIISAKILERYKNTQSFILNEMENGKYKFTGTSKEIVLLYADSAYRWLERLEYSIISHKYTVDINQERIDEMTSSLVACNEYVTSIIREHPKVFKDKAIAEAWIALYTTKETQIRMMDEVPRVINGLKDKVATVVFTKIGELFADALDEVRLTLYEIDSMATSNGEKAPLCVSDWDIDRINDALPRIKFKAKYYMEHFNVKAFRLKDFTLSSSFFRQYSRIISKELPVKEISV